MPEPAFASQFEFTPDNSAVVISLAGRLDAEAVEDLHPRIQGAYRSGTRRFVFDLDQLQHSGSIGLRLFLMLHQQVKGKGRVALCRLSGPVQTLLDMMKLREVLAVCASREEALEATKG